MATPILPKNATGIKLCLTHLNLLKEKKSPYLRNAIHFFNKGLTPWEGSVITFNPQNGFFHYINRHEIELITTWSDYSPSSLCFIREHTFLYSNSYPYLFVVSDSKWVRDNLNESEDEMAVRYYAYLQEHIEIERNRWKIILEGNNLNVKKLF